MDNGKGKQPLRINIPKEEESQNSRQSVAERSSGRLRSALTSPPNLSPTLTQIKETQRRLLSFRAATGDLLRTLMYNEFEKDGIEKELTRLMHKTIVATRELTTYMYSKVPATSASADQVKNIASESVQCFKEAVKDPSPQNVSNFLKVFGALGEAVHWQVECFLRLGHVMTDGEMKSRLLSNPQVLKGRVAKDSDEIINEIDHLVDKEKQKEEHWRNHLLKKEKELIEKYYGGSHNNDSPYANHPSGNRYSSIIEYEYSISMNNKSVSVGHSGISLPPGHSTKKPENPSSRLNNGERQNATSEKSISSVQSGNYFYNFNPSGQIRDTSAHSVPPQTNESQRQVQRVEITPHINRMTAVTAVSEEDLRNSLYDATPRGSTAQQSRLNEFSRPVENVNIKPVHDRFTYASHDSARDSAQASNYSTLYTSRELPRIPSLTRPRGHTISGSSFSQQYEDRSDFDSISHQSPRYGWNPDLADEPLHVNSRLSATDNSRTKHHSLITQPATQYFDDIPSPSRRRSSWTTTSYVPYEHRQSSHTVPSQLTKHSPGSPNSVKTIYNRYSLSLLPFKMLELEKDLLQAGDIDKKEEEVVNYRLRSPSHADGNVFDYDAIDINRDPEYEKSRGNRSEDVKRRRSYKYNESQDVLNLAESSHRNRDRSKGGGTHQLPSADKNSVEMSEDRISIPEVRFSSPVKLEFDLSFMKPPNNSKTSGNNATSQMNASTFSSYPTEDLIPSSVDEYEAILAYALKPGERRPSDDSPTLTPASTNPKTPSTMMLENSPSVRQMNRNSRISGRSINTNLSRNRVSRFLDDTSVETESTSSSYTQRPRFVSADNRLEYPVTGQNAIASPNVYLNSFAPYASISNPPALTPVTGHNTHSTYTFDSKRMFSPRVESMQFRDSRPSVTLSPSVSFYKPPPPRTPPPEPLIHQRDSYRPDSQNVSIVPSPYLLPQPQSTSRSQSPYLSPYSYIPKSRSTPHQLHHAYSDDNISVSSIGDQGDSYIDYPSLIRSKSNKSKSSSRLQYEDPERNRHIPQSALPSSSSVSVSTRKQSYIKVHPDLVNPYKDIPLIGRSKYSKHRFENARILPDVVRKRCGICGFKVGILEKKVVCRGTIFLLSHINHHHHPFPTS
ncbi:hypothetical protein BKA69DRAFT_1035516 [Paraphysoderma sedebokerense]|nr:hypothetical protein BKA69DRAFT_1035516 [Paraphysoderma sedebokerense]